MLLKAVGNGGEQDQRAKMLVLNFLAIFEHLKRPPALCIATSSSSSSLLAGDESLLLLSLQALQSLIKCLNPLRHALMDASQAIGLSSDSHPELVSPLRKYRMGCHNDSVAASKPSLFLSDNLLAQLIQSLLFFCSEKGANSCANVYGKSKEVVREALNVLLSVCVCCYGSMDETGEPLQCKYALYMDKCH